MLSTAGAIGDASPVPESLGGSTSDLIARITAADGSVEAMLALAAYCGTIAPVYGAGNTLQRWDLLATIAAEDVSAARVVEAHLDALAILGEAADTPTFDCSQLLPLGVTDASTWGVFAAEASGVRLQAESVPGGWELSGVKPWCSLAAWLSHALVTAYTPGGDRRLFAVALQDGTVRPTGQQWVARGLQQVPSTSIELSHTPAIPVGPDSWYLARPGFAWGGAGVAACWFGGAVGVARHLMASGAAKPADQLADLHLGAVDVALTGVRAVLHQAARQIDNRLAEGDDGALMALRVRAAAAAAAEEVLQRSAHALGPAPLALDDRHARRIADLQMYVRQHHAERDVAALGRAVRAGGGQW